MDGLTIFKLVDDITPMICITCCESTELNGQRSMSWHPYIMYAAHTLE